MLLCLFYPPNIFLVLTILFQSYKSGQFDDNDGHYIVVPDADLTDNCKFHPTHHASSTSWSS